MAEEDKRRRGFAAMSAEMQRSLASKGGRAAHEGGVKKDGTPRKSARTWNHDEAQAAGKKGGTVTYVRKVGLFKPKPAADPPTTEGGNTA